MEKHFVFCGENTFPEVPKVKGSKKEILNRTQINHKKVSDIKHFVTFASVERKILYYKRYFPDFYQSIEDGAQRKMDYVLDMLKTQQNLNQRFVKHIRDGIYEYRKGYQTKERTPLEKIQNMRETGRKQCAAAPLPCRGGECHAACLLMVVDFFKWTQKEYYASKQQS